MAGLLFTNNASAALASSITTSSTTITVTTGSGALFPAISGGNYFYATLTDSSNNLEIVKVTARATDVMTVVRAQEGTTARAYAAADKIELRVTAAGMNSLAQLGLDNTFTGINTFSTPIAVASGGTGGTTSTGSGAVVLAASPTFTGVPIAPTASSGTNTTQIATTAFVAAATGTLGTMSTQNANAVAITGGTASGLTSLGVSGTATATTFSGAGTSLTGTAASLSIGGNATTATTATDTTNILGSSSQAYGNYIGSRAINTTYTNSTGKPIWVAVAWTATGNGNYTATVNGNLAYFTLQDIYPRANVDFVVPIGATYSVSSSVGQAPAYWYELR